MHERATGSQHNATSGLHHNRTALVSSRTEVPITTEIGKSFCIPKYLGTHLIVGKNSGPVRSQKVIRKCIPGKHTILSTFQST